MTEAELLELHEATEKVRHLETALHTSRRIGMAIGILMERMKVSEDHAVDQLKQASQRTQRKLRDIAEELVQTGTAPGLG